MKTSDLRAINHPLKLDVLQNKHHSYSMYDYLNAIKDQLNKIYLDI